MRTASLWCVTGGRGGEAHIPSSAGSLLGRMSLMWREKRRGPRRYWRKGWHPTLVQLAGRVGDLKPQVLL